MLEILAPALEKNNIKVPSIIYSEKRLGDVMRNYSDTSKAQRMLGWITKVSLQEGLASTIYWFVKTPHE